MFRPLFLFFFLIMVFGCGDPVEPVTAGGPPPPPDPGPPPPIATLYSFQVFDNIDSVGKMHGVGYDIYQGSKRMIHQVSIPGEQGNEGFVTRDEAEKVAQLVITKLRAASGFPTITREEMDSLGITLQPIAQ